MCTFVPHDRSSNRTPALCLLPGKLHLQPGFRSSSTFPACVQVNEHCSQTIPPQPPPSRTGSNRAGTAGQPNPATKSTFVLYPLCRECQRSSGSSGTGICRTAGRLAIAHSHQCAHTKVFRGSLACLKPQQGASLKVRLKHPHSLVSHTKIHRDSSGIKTGLRSFAKSP